MATFKDSTGREWSLKMTVGDLAVLKRDAGIDFGPRGEKLGEVLFAEPEALVKGVWLLAGGQHAGVDEDQFHRAIDGEALHRAGVALLEAGIEVIHFRRAAGMKARLPALLAKWEQQVDADVAARIDALLADDTKPEK